MRFQKKPVASQEAPGAPKWMVTFSDCMTLLLTFFVLMLTFSSFDEHSFRKAQAIFSQAMPAVSQQPEEGRDALLAPGRQVVSTENLGEGSEKPTIARGWDNNLKEDTEPTDFRQRKVFLIPSKKIFWAKGTIISFQGRKTLSAMASFLKEVPERVVISENEGTDENSGDRLGLSRAWEVIQYFITKQGLNKKRFNMSATSTVTQESFKSSELSRPQREAERVLEIVLLERSVYN